MLSCFKNLVQLSQSYHNFTKKKITITKKNLKLNLASRLLFKQQNFLYPKLRVKVKFTHMSHTKVLIGGLFWAELPL
jgi:hypothetical protein